MRIYCAGAYSASNILDVFENMRKGIRLSTEAFLAGYFVFCPFIDYHFALQLRDGERLTIGDFYKYSLAWLEVSDAILLVPGWEDSVGTKAEIVKAGELGIPIFNSLEELKEKFPIAKE